MKLNRVVSLLIAVALLLAISTVAFAQDADIVDTAAANDDLSSLVLSVQTADLVSALKGDGPLTVFAPNNAAFEVLADNGTLDELLADPSGELTDILLYHIVPGKVMSTDLTDGQVVETLNGEMLPISVSDGGAKVSYANIVQPDIEASNGVIHIIDAVLDPSAEAVMDADADGDELMAKTEDLSAVAQAEEDDMADTDVDTDADGDAMMAETEDLSAVAQAEEGDTADTDTDADADGDAYTDADGDAMMAETEDLSAVAQAEEGDTADTDSDVDTDVEADTDADVIMIPVELPVTGTSPLSLPISVSLVSGLMAAMAAAAIIVRRR